MGLDLTHRRDVALRDLMVIFHIVLQALVIIFLHFLIRSGAIFVELVRLIISLGESYLISGIHG